MLPLSINMKATFLQSFDCAQMIYARKLWHQLAGHDFHFANLASRFGLAVQLHVAANCVLDVCQRFIDRVPLGVTTGKLWTTNRNALVVLNNVT